MSKWFGSEICSGKFLKLSKMNISIEKKSGFCYGVIRVIEMAEEHLRNGEEVWCLGQIVHNEAEVGRLEGLGMKFIEHKDLPDIKNVKLLIRAHGEPPSTYETARRNNLEIIEGTCPIVQRLQKKIRTGFNEADKENEMVIIYGKEDHPEVIGLMGQTNNEALIINSPDEANSIPLKQKVILYSQTTMDIFDYETIISRLQARLAETGGELFVNKTICGHVSHRRPGLEKFASDNDVIIFAGGKKSSNARYLFNVCKSANDRSYFVSDAGEIKKEWFTGAASTGICGATSTPAWQLKQIADLISQI